MRVLPVRILTAAALALPASLGILALAGPAGADSTSATVALAAPAAISYPAALPNSNIVAKSSSFIFKPGKLSAVWSGPPRAGTCSAALGRITITNKTSKKQVITSGGKTFGALPAKTFAYV